MLDANYWEQRWQNGQTGWDIGYPSPAIIQYASGFPKNTRILIPGAGRAHEALWLHEHDFTNVFVCDWAASAFDTLIAKAPTFPADHLLVGNFFELDISVDLILEQTFFCAIELKLRPAYATKVATLLPPGGKLAGLFWAREFDKQGPPFGGNLQEYEALFSPYFHFLQTAISADSIGPRAGTEHFIELQKH